jgi:glycogen synthase
MLLTPAAFAADPRAQRAAAMARELGWNVTVLDADAEPVREPHSEIRMLHVHPGRATAALRRANVGGFQRDQGTLKRELRGLFRLVRLALLNSRLARAGKGAGAADVIHANDLETLPAAIWLARRSGARLVYDAHEIYSSQEPNPPRLQRAGLLALERLLGRRADSVVTVSAPIAAELKARLGLRRTPFVVLNCPALTEAPEPAPTGTQLRVIYQGAMGPGRDVADIFAAADVAPNVHFSVRLVGADLSALRAHALSRGLGNRVEILDPVDSSALVSALAGFDVGIIINRPVTLNDELVLPNKLFEYLMAGLAVVTPRLPSLAALIDEESVGAMYEPSDPLSLGAVLEELATNPNEIMMMKRRARRAAVERYNGDAQRAALYASWGR